MSSRPAPAHPFRPVLTFALLGGLTLALFLVSRSGLEGAARTVVLVILMVTQAAVALELLVDLRRERRWLQLLLVLVLVFLVGLLIGPVLSQFTAPIEIP